MLIAGHLSRSPGTAAFSKPVDKRNILFGLAKKQLSIQKMNNLRRRWAASLICIVWQDRWMLPSPNGGNPPRADARLADSDPREPTASLTPAETERLFSRLQGCLLLAWVLFLSRISCRKFADCRSD